jgi:peptidylprolyl isomerase
MLRRNCYEYLKLQSSLRNKFNKMPFRNYMQEQPTIRKNLKAYFDISIDQQPKGRIVFILFAQDCPRTALNFYHLCKGDIVNPKTNKPLNYKGSKFHRVIPGFMCQGGDIVKGDGTGSISIYGDSFGDENFVFSHDQPGLLSMANRGPNTNGSQFFITTADCGWLDGKHVVFGKIEEGIEVLNAIESYGTSQGRPKADIKITDCGVLDNSENQDAIKHKH